ncbi:MAG: hypothetical protein Q8R55_05880 [Candidatus Taylorbacteria bacterium]|nr:hypothetical protein [Candidatus Taylorbacteria bacterium]
MQKVTFGIKPIVCVTITGSGEYRSRKDNGLVARFLQFQIDNQIYTAVRGGYSGAGSYCGFFAPEDVAKIEAWFIEQGAKKDGRR